MRLAYASMAVPPGGRAMRLAYASMAVLLQ